MNPIERLEKRWLTDKALQALSTDEAKPIIEALAVTIYADLNADESEEDAYDAMVLTLPCGWSEVDELDQHATRCAARAAELDSLEAVSTRIAELVEKIPDNVYEQVFEMLIALTASDLEMRESEVAALSQFGTAFGFDQPQADAIYNRIIEAMGLVAEGDQT